MSRLLRSVVLIHIFTIGAVFSGTTVWDAGTNPRIIAATVTINSGDTLIIDPGVVVKFNSGTGLIVGGMIVADSVLFTSNVVTPSPGDWNGIEFQNSADVNSIFNNNIVEYGGAGSNAANIFYKTGAPNIKITNSLIRYSSNHGINPRSSSPRIYNTAIRQNAGYGIFADLSLNFIVDSCTISNNTVGGILIGVNSTTSIIHSALDSNGTGIFISNSAAPTITKNYIRYNNIGIQFTGVGATQPTISEDTIVNNITWGFLNTSTTTTVLARRNYWGSDTGPFNASSNPTGLGDDVSNRVDFQPWTILTPTLPYVAVTTNIASNTTWSSGVYWIKNDIAINTGFRLTILPGVIVKLAIGARLTVNGSIDANGTPDSLIVFTSERDDSYGGDTNGDSTATLAAKGNWDMVWLNAAQNSTSVLSNCIFKWGGSTGNGNVRVDNATPIIDSIFSTQSSYYGLYLNNGANVTVSNSTFGSNNNYGIYIPNSNPTIYASTISSNGSYGINATGNSRFYVRKTKITGNTYGIVADGGTSSATLISLDSSNISFNTSGGLYLWYGTGPQTIAYNRIEGNGGGYGIWCFNVNDIVTIDSNIILNHGAEGIITSRASIINNLIKGNSYPISLIGRVNSTYSGNTIDSNLYNNALGLRANRIQESLRDTLSTVFPAGITSKTYVLIDIGSSVVVDNGTTLVIQPGVVIKMNPTMYFRVDGTLIADGTPSDPIVFTSYRDASYGGKTNLLSDITLPAPNDWRYVRLYTNTSNGTIFDNCIFKYGGQDGVGNLYMSNDVVLANPITNTIFRKSSSVGIYISDCQVTFDNVTLDSNASHGMYVVGNRPSDVTIRNSYIQDNNNTGLQAVNNSAFREVSNCFIRRNNGWGIGTSSGTLDQVYQGNTINNNTSGGIYTNSPPVLAGNLRFVGNTITDHPTGDGILSSRATFIDNTIKRNRYPLAVWRRTGNIYTDPSGVDGNIISDNVYNAIAIWDADISDTLKATFPDSITSKTYVAIYDFEVAAGTTLVIEPGVIVKFQQIPANNWQQFNVYGTLIANGTQANPIVFTSWRDATVGGKTTSLTDTIPPAPGDWNYIAFRNGSGASVVRHCQFKYGGRDGQQTVYFETNVGGVVFSNNLVRRSSSAGIYVYNTAVIIDSTTVDSCATTGIRVTTNAANNVTLLNSKILKNNNYGIWVQNPAKLSVMSNCNISYNTYTGVYVENNSVALSILNNTISNNGDHGLYIVARNDAIDTLLMIAGNNVRNNGLAGIFSSRAYIVDDSISGNRYPIGVTGQLSLTGTGTSIGNVYQNNIITGNTYNNILLTQENVFGELGASMPPNYSKVIAVRGDLNISSGTTLHIAPGSIIKFPKEYGSGYIQVNGTLLSEGTTNNKIVFTSWKDDTYGGDTNLDTSLTLPVPGDWNRIQLSGATTNASHFMHTIVRYGDVSGFGSLDFDQTTAAIESCFVSYAKFWGMQLTNSSSRITGSEIHHNESGLFINGSTVPSVSQNNIYLNTTYGLYSSSTGTTTDADSNYWGSNLGPFVNQGSDQNPTGTGDRIYISGTGEVDYRPFFFSRSGILPGDVSGNGLITAFDGSLILRHIVGADSLNSVQQIAANVSGDSTISALDASYILRYVVGLISGFPGLGKQSLTADALSAFSFTIEKSQLPNQFDLIVHLNKPVNVYGVLFSLGFDTSLVQAVGMKRGEASDSMSIAHHFPKGKANVALAGLYPLNTAGDIARFTFKLLDPARAKETILFTVKKFILNEEDVTSDVGSIVLNVKDVADIPTTFGLDQNYPNPFNPTTTIRYQVPSVSRVMINIYNMLGQKVHTLVNDMQAPGYYMLQWNGTDDHGRSLASGVYIYRIEAVSSANQKFVSTKKMLFVK
ncbi:MAG: right-handed parallel beta-helix repeat-containing protein [Ignavibacteriales bacterium]|nr:right-handed parallel beta-helix repeat-containing protein [Ignavibacteriales bacterium]